MSKEADLETRISREVEWQQMKKDIDELREWREECTGFAKEIVKKMVMFFIGIIAIGTLFGYKLDKAHEWLLSKIL